MNKYSASWAQIGLATLVHPFLPLPEHGDLEIMCCVGLSELQHKQTGRTTVGAGLLLLPAVIACMSDQTATCFSLLRTQKSQGYQEWSVSEGLSYFISRSQRRVSFGEASDGPPRPVDASSCPS